VKGLQAFKMAAY